MSTPKNVLILATLPVTQPVPEIAVKPVKKAPKAKPVKKAPAKKIVVPAAKRGRKEKYTVEMLTRFLKDVSNRHSNIKKVCSMRKLPYISILVALSRNGMNLRPRA